MKHLFRSILLSHSATISADYSQSLNTYAGLGHHHTLSWIIFSKLIHFRLWLGARTRYQWLAGAVFFVTVPAVFFAAQFLLPHNTSYSYASDTCFYNPTFLPNIVSKQASEHFALQTPARASVGNRALLSTQTCISLTSIPEEPKQESLHLKGILFFSKSVKVNTPELPKLSPSTATSEPISQKEGLHFTTDIEDKTFAYEVLIDDQKAACPVQGREIFCPLAKLGLAQGKSYDYTLIRIFNDQYSTVLDSKFLLRDPLVVTKSSITEATLIQDKPTELTLELSKDIKKFSVPTLSYDDITIPLTSTQSDKKLIITFAEPLPRGKKLTLTIESGEATDGAYFESPYTLNFETSTGPKVAGVNIGNYKVSASANISIRFDAPLDTTAAKFVSLNNTDGSVNTIILVDGSSLLINPTATLNACSTYTLTVRDDIPNTYGVSGDSAWSMKFRTTCQVVYSVGSSVEGRSITAYKFGSGSKRVLFIGGLHGNETSSFYTLNAWVDELEQNYHLLPSGVTAVVIPNANPDGFASGSRTNAHSVDLNRNFPSNDWVTGVYMPGGIYADQGGGSSPLSEPESLALASYIGSFAPELVLTYHAQASAVFSNGVGSASSLASTYATKSGFGAYDSSHEDGIFSYPTTGELEAWLADKKSLPTLLVELATLGGNEIYTQRSALWAMLQ
ncbi:DUF2817 domain-containing protein [Candidatus Saccharibacteria bacterium]|nr:DUF2817 domain-containing protein [Candidatus Saccharibacteria bacterium]